MQTIVRVLACLAFTGHAKILQSSSARWPSNSYTQAGDNTVTVCKALRTDAGADAQPDAHMEKMSSAEPRANLSKLITIATQMKEGGVRATSVKKDHWKDSRELLTLKGAFPRFQIRSKVRCSLRLLVRLLLAKDSAITFNPSCPKALHSTCSTLGLAVGTCLSSQVPTVSMKKKHHFPGRDNHANQRNPNNKEFWGSRNFGKHCWALMKTEECLNHMLEQWSPKVRVAALGSDSYFLSHGNGDTSWWGIPIPLDELVREQNNAGYSVTYLSLGPGDAYFVLFDDRRAEWTGHSQELTRVIHDQWYNHDSVVNLLAFAPRGGYFVKFDDGWWKYHNLPWSLQSFLNRNVPRVGSISTLSISDNGSAWFVSFSDGRKPKWKAEGLPQMIMEIIGGMENSSIIRAVELGSSGNWLIRTTRPLK